MTDSLRRTTLEILHPLALQLLPHSREDGACIWESQWCPAKARNPSMAHQWVHLTFHLLAFAPELPKDERDRFREAGCRNLAYGLGLIEPDPHAPSWATSQYQERLDSGWNTWAILCSLLLLQQHAPDDPLIESARPLVRALGNRCVRRIESNSKRLTNREFCSNILMWELALCHRAGVALNEPRWRDVANTLFRTEVLSAQWPEGYWCEMGLPTTRYHHISQMALGVHWLQEGGHAEERDALLRAMRFAQQWSYPDGSAIETVDGRVTYRKQTPVELNPAWALLHGGPAALRDRLRRIRDDHQEPVPHLPDHLGWLSFFLETLPDSEEPATARAVEPVAKLASLPAAQVRKEGWVIVLNGTTRPSLPGHFFTDCQQHLSLFHEKTGLVLGGGNSRRDAYFSTFFRFKGDGAFLATGCDGIAVDDRGGEIILRYREDKMALRATVLDGRRAEVVARWLTPEPASAWEMGFMIPSPPGSCWSFTDETDITVGPNLRINKIAAGEPPCRHATLNGRLRFSMQPQDGTLRWPMLSYTPYQVLPHETLDHASARLAAVIDSVRTGVTLHVEVL